MHRDQESALFIMQELEADYLFALKGNTIRPKQMKCPWYGRFTPEDLAWNLCPICHTLGASCARSAGGAI